jgi:hypothetical protein
MDIIVESGEKISSPGKCVQIPVELQGWNFCIDFYILPLEGYGLVLSTQWLRILGPFWWDFKKLRMKFIWEGKEVMLYGLNTWDKRKGEMLLSKQNRLKLKEI